MAKIIVFGATGKAGSRIVGEAVGRGHHVVAVAREGAAIAGLPAGVQVASGDGTSQDSVGQLAPGADVLVVAVGGPDKSVYAAVARAVVATLAPLAGSGPRVIHMGGAGSLLNANGERLVDTPAIPPQLQPEVRGQAAALDVYRASKGVRWTYVSPPPRNFAPGERKGHYRTGLDHPVAAPDGSTGISYEDFAMAIVDEIENARFVGTRFTVGY